jgi:hypothetical protein
MSSQGQSPGRRRPSNERDSSNVTEMETDVKGRRHISDDLGVRANRVNVLKRAIGAAIGLRIAT